METAVKLCKRFEGFRSKPYYCPAGILTIGYGHVILSNEIFTEITEAEAEVLLYKDLEKAKASTLRLCPELLLESEARQSAIIDFTFNLGSGRLQSSTLRKKINAKDWEEVKVQLRKWVYARAKKLPGLVLRREAEAQLI